MKKIRSKFAGICKSGWTHKGKTVCADCKQRFHEEELQAEKEGITGEG